MRRTPLGRTGAAWQRARRPPPQPPLDERVPVESRWLAQGAAAAPGQPWRFQRSPPVSALAGFKSRLAVAGWRRRGA
ncbi:hypothetical protein AB1Y20_021505 [Prymnesium parvum]|uniref:Uncharacterized protein n=1 Tax=Prymnesium parvum TaxID=97485 RepID=A0AB34JK09_PRYPA